MAQCIKCGKKGLFLKANEKRLCESCAHEEHDAELKIRQSANERAKYMLSITESIRSTLDTIVSFGEAGGYSHETIEAAIQILNEALDETGKAVAVVRDPDISKIQPAIEAAEQTVDRLHAKFLELIETETQLEARDPATIFVQTLESLPIVEVSISETPAKKRTIEEIQELTFSSITGNAPRGNLGDFVAIDAETTGLHASSAEIVEISAIRFRDFKPIEAFTSLCYPKKGISEEAAKINGITAEMVEGKPQFSQIAQALQDFIGTDNLVGHNLKFDLEFIVKHGVDIAATERKYYDTLSIARCTLKKIERKWDDDVHAYMEGYSRCYGVENYKLATLCQFYKIPLPSAHRALADCYATGLLLEQLAKSVNRDYTPQQYKPKAATVQVGITPNTQSSSKKEPSNQSVIAAAVLLLAFLGIACGIGAVKSDGAGEDKPTSIANDLPQPSDSPFSSITIIYDDERTIAIKAEIVDALAAYFPAEALKISKSANSTTITVISGEWAEAISAAQASDSIPEGWADLQAGLCAVTESMPTLPDTARTVVMLKDSEDGDIFLNVSLGKVMYDAFEQK